MQMAVEIHKSSPIMLTAAFLPETHIPNIWAELAIPVSNGYTDTIVEQESSAAVKKSIQLFNRTCERYRIEHSIHSHSGETGLSELIKESRFADLLILGTDQFTPTQNTGIRLSNYLDSLLHSAECPVLLVPNKATLPTNTILCYDGSGASSFAIKQFAYLFPELCNNPAMLVHMSKEEELPLNLLVQELLQAHFPDISIETIDPKEKDYFSNWISSKKGVVLVAGAFERSEISRVFKRSFIASMMEAHQLPIFIAHR